MVHPSGFEPPTFCSGGKRQFHFRCRFSGLTRVKRAKVRRIGRILWGILWGWGFAYVKRTRKAPEVPGTRIKPGFRYGLTPMPGVCFCSRSNPLIQQIGFAPTQAGVRAVVSRARPEPRLIPFAPEETNVKFIALAESAVSALSLKWSEVDFGVPGIKIRDYVCKSRSSFRSCHAPIS